MNDEQRYLVTDVQLYAELHSAVSGSDITFLVTEREDATYRHVKVLIPDEDLDRADDIRRIVASRLEALSERSPHVYETDIGSLDDTIQPVSFRPDTD